MFDSADVDLLLQSFEEDAYPSDDTVKYLVAVTNLRRRFLGGSGILYQISPPKWFLYSELYIGLKRRNL